MDVGNIELTDQWRERVERYSDIVISYIQECELDDSSGWGERLKILLDQPLDVRPSGIVLTGPSGCGKHTAAKHVVQALLQDSYGCVFLNGRDLSAEADQFHLIKERINGLLDDFYDRGKGLCLILEQLSSSKCYQELMLFLSQIVCEYWINREEYPPVFLVVISEKELEMPALLRERLQTCFLSVPNHECRRIFLEQRAKGIHKYVPLEAVADLTEHFTYAQLVALVKNLELVIDQTNSALDGEQLKAFIEAQTPPPAKNEILRRLTTKIEAFLDSFPAWLANAGKGVYAVDVPAQQMTQQNSADIPIDQEAYIAQEYERISNAPVRQVSEELFGKERVEKLIQKYE